MLQLLQSFRIVRDGSAKISEDYVLSSLWLVSLLQQGLNRQSETQKGLQNPRDPAQVTFLLKPKGYDLHASGKSLRVNGL